MKVMCALLMLAVAAVAEGPIEEGNRAFTEGRYTDAVHHYLEAQERGGFQPDLLFNLGNAYARSGDVGRAVLSYERARLLAPRDSGIRDALDALRRGSGLHDDVDRGWRDAHRYLTPDEWTWLAVAGGGLLLGAFLGRRLSRAARARLVGAALLLGLPAATGIVKHAVDGNRAVVVAAGETPLRVSPYEAAEASGSVRAGGVVRAGRAFEDFVLVTKPGESAGWIARSAVEPVVP